MSKLQSILDSLEFIQQSSAEELTLIVIDTEKVVAFLRAATTIKANINIPIGTPISYLGDDSSMVRALRTGQQYREEFGPEKYGIPFITTATPIKDNGKVVGAISILQNIDKLHTIKNSSADLASVIEEMSATTDEVSDSSIGVTNELKGLQQEVVTMKNSITEINKVLSVVQEVAAQSHMLGLNAAIEAARAGEYGRGFSVVANEIRKMAETSKNTVKEVQGRLTQINKEIETMDVRIESISANAETHAASMQELNGAFSHIAEVASNLATLVE